MANGAVRQVASLPASQRRMAFAGWDETGVRVIENRKSEPVRHGSRLHGQIRQIADGA